MALRDVLAFFKVEVDDKQLKKLDGGLEGTVEKLSAVGKAFAGGLLLNEAKEFLASQIELGSQLNDTSERLGIGTADLQEFQFATGLAGVDAEGAALSLQFLNKAIGGAIGGNKEAVASFASLGIAVSDGAGGTRELADLIPEIADAFVGMNSDAERTVKAMSLFGKQGAKLIPFLKQGSEGIEGMREEFEALGGAIDDSFILAADEAGDEIDKLKFAMTGFKTQIAIAILPTLTEWVKKVQGVVAMARSLAKETNIVKVALFALGAAAAFSALKMTANLAKAFGVATKESSGFGKAMNLLGLGIKGGVIVAALLAIALAVEDLYTLFTGGDSVIGRFIDTFAGVGASKKFVEDMTKAGKELWSALGLIGEALKPLGTLFKEIFGIGILEAFGHWLTSNLKFFVAVIKTVESAVRGLMGFIGQAMQPAADWLDAAGAHNTAKSLRESSFRLGVLKDFKTADLGPGGDSFVGSQGRTEASSAPAAVSGPITTAPAGAVTQINDIKIDVKGGDSPQETGRNVNQGVRDATATALAAIRTLG